MSASPQITEGEYEQIVLAKPIERWELVAGQLREKPGNSWDHSRVVSELIYWLYPQLDPRQHLPFIGAHVRCTKGTVFRPDVTIVPVEYGREFAGRPVLAIFSRPLPFLVEIWAPSTGDYDVDTKIPEYQKRDDLEIWRVHPYQKTITVWCRQPNGVYVESRHDRGGISLHALPDVSLALDDLFPD